MQHDFLKKTLPLLLGIAFLPAASAMPNDTTVDPTDVVVPAASQSTPSDAEVPVEPQAPTPTPPEPNPTPRPLPEPSPVPEPVPPAPYPVYQTPPLDIEPLSFTGTESAQWNALLAHDDFNRRMGDVHLMNAADGNGLRVRSIGLETHAPIDEYISSKARGTFYEVGYDRLFRRDGRSLLLGAAVTYLEGKTTIPYQYGAKQIRFHGFGAGLFATMIDEDGWYLDAALRLQRFKHADSWYWKDLINHEKTRTAYAASLETGRNIRVGSMLFVEPQAQVVYAVLGKGRVERRDVETGVAYSEEMKRQQTLMTRIGLRAGLRSGEKGEIHVRGDIHHQWLARTATGPGYFAQEISRGTWYELGLGAQYALTKSLTVSGGVSHVFSSPWKEGTIWRVNAMYRF